MATPPGMDDISDPPSICLMPPGSLRSALEETDGQAVAAFMDVSSQAATSTNRWMTLSNSLFDDER